MMSGTTHARPEAFEQTIYIHIIPAVGSFSFGEFSLTNQGIRD